MVLVAVNVVSADSRFIVPSVPENDSAVIVAGVALVLIIPLLTTL